MNFVYKAALNESSCAILLRLHCDCMAAFAKQIIPNFFCWETPKETFVLVILNLQT